MFLCAASMTLYAQSERAYSDDNSSSITKLIDPSRLTVNHSLNFDMGGSSASDLKSQSMYTTMMRYQFNAPITLSFNFGMPIHSTLASEHNFTQDNLQSMDYFKNMPLSASLSWKPSDNLFLNFSVSRQSTQHRYQSDLFPASRHFNDLFYRGIDSYKRKEMLRDQE